MANRFAFIFTKTASRALSAALIMGMGLGFPAAASPASAPLRVPVTRMVLHNGLTVLLHEDHSVPRVHFGVRYHVGSSSERVGRTGFAHLFEHLMFEGSKHVPEGKFDEWLEAAGGENNAFTSEDQTFYFEEVPRNAVELPLFLESDRLGFFASQLSASLVDGQRDVVKNERRQSYENRPWGHADLLLPALVWPKGHPYSWPVIGSMEDLSAASLDDVRAFHETWYAPANAILVVAGDFETARMRALVEHWFSDVSARPAPPRAHKAPHRLTGEKRAVVEDARAPLARLQVVWPSPALFDPDDAPLDVAAAILARGAGSRLQRRLMHELQIAQSVSAAQGSMERAGMFVVDVIAQPGVELPQLLRVVDDELARLVAAGVTDEELARARTVFETAFAGQLDSLGQKALRLATYEAHLGEADGFERDLARMRRVTSADVVSAVRRWLHAGRLVMSVVPAGARDVAVVNASRAGGTP